MSPSSPDFLMHAVLDDEASAAQRAEFDRLLESDPALRSRFESLRQVVELLAAVPNVEPPANLVDSILARVMPHRSSPTNPATSHQLYSAANVLVASAVGSRVIRPEPPTIGSWFSRVVHFIRELGMSDQNSGFLGSTKGRLLVTAGVAAVAVIALSTVIDFPTGAGNSTGTIVPAERHRAAQNSADDIKVGLPGGSLSAPAPGSDVAASGAAGQVGAVAAGVAAEQAAGAAARVAQFNSASTAEMRAGAVAAEQAAGSAARVAQLNSASNAEMKAGAAAEQAAGVAARVAQSSAASNAEMRAGAAAEQQASRIAQRAAQSRAASSAEMNAGASAAQQAAGVAASNAAANAAGKANLRQ